MLILKKINAEIPFTPSYLELCIHAYIYVYIYILQLFNKLLDGKVNNVIPDQTAP